MSGIQSTCKFVVKSTEKVSSIKNCGWVFNLSEITKHKFRGPVLLHPSEIKYGEGNGTNSMVLALGIPGAEEPCELPPMGLHRLRHG